MKHRTCKSCQKEYTPEAIAQPRCQQCRWKAQKAKKFEQLKKQYEKPLKPIKKIKQKIDAKWKPLADKIKERDKGKPCISCGKQMQEHEIQAGHFISRANSTELYYEERNIYAQCRECNNDHQNQQKVSANFRRGIIARCGIEEVEWLEEVKRKEWQIVEKTLL